MWKERNTIMISINTLNRAVEGDDSQGWKSVRVGNAGPWALLEALRRSDTTHGGHFLFESPVFLPVQSQG